jgi:hypothetical protein
LLYEEEGERSRSKRGRNRSKNERIDRVVAFFVVLQVTTSSPVQKGKGEEANLDCPVSRLLSRRRVNPRAAILPAFPESFPVIPIVLGVVL